MIIGTGRKRTRAMAAITAIFRRVERHVGSRWLWKTRRVGIVMARVTTYWITGSTGYRDGFMVYIGGFETGGFMADAAIGAGA